MSDKNLETYNSKGVVKWYTGLKGIVPAEAAVLEQHKALIAGASLLDIGIGGGRTTAYLIDKCKDYTGIDYSQGFVNVLKKQYPQVKILAMDARDLSAYSIASFDFVNFSFNGMDYADLAGREKILAEINRVLKPGGIFFFSTHNKNHTSFNEWPWLNKKISLTIKLKTFVKLIPFLTRKIKNRGLETFTSDYAIINDSAHNYGLMTFYTTPQFLSRQLAQANFKDAVFYNDHGQPAAGKDLDDWIYATAKKNA